jgi:uracil DNA glycosylase superfamily protein
MPTRDPVPAATEDDVSPKPEPARQRPHTERNPGSVSTLEHAIDGLSMPHFEALRERVNARLRQIRAPHARRQIEEFPWLYGALGQVPSRVMLVCENPSLAGVEKANFRTINGRQPTIEDQWAGGPTSNCIKRLRPALCEVGLKVTPPDRPGGWRCYITNVIKEADVVKDFVARDKQSIAMQWADVLAWEIEQVRPSVIFTLGAAATKLVRTLQDRSLIPAFPRPYKVMHYSNRGADACVQSSMTRDLESALLTALLVEFAVGRCGIRCTTGSIQWRTGVICAW